MRYRVWLAATLWLASALLPDTAVRAADAPVTIILRQNDSAETIRRAVEAGKAAGSNVIVRFEDAPARAGAPTAPKAAEAGFDGLREAFLQGVRAGNDHLRFVPALFDDFARHWRAVRNGPFPAGLPLAVLGLSIGVGFVVRRAVRRLLVREGVSDGPDLLSRFDRACRLLVANLAALAAFLLVARASAGWLLPEPDFARSLARGVASGGLLGLGYLIVGDVLLRPGPSGKPLLALPRPGLHLAFITCYGLFGAFILIVVGLGLQHAADQRSVGGLFTLLGLAITVLKIVWFWTGRRDFAQLALAGAENPENPGRARTLLAHAAGPLLILSAILIWIIGRIAAVAPDGARWASAAGQTQVAVVIVPLLAGGLVALLRARRRRRGSAEKASAPLAKALGVVLERGAGALVWAAGAVFLGRLWRDFLLDPSSAESLALLRSLVSSALLLSAGWIVWVFLVAWFDAHRPRPASHAEGNDEDAAQPVATRLGTVLPVLRGVVLGAVVGLTLLLLLARLGVDIAPLLAGFGILGLAISFGSQALVRDIVSGIFFMAEDAFRVGEYIDTGRLKGTVEKISIRSVRLRHQSGQIHTVPFGQITAVTNASRDWATVKFNIRLDRDVDIERARKAIKKVGIAMQEDPDLKADIIQPLKMQGIADIAENAIVVRLKLTSTPSRASYLQREGTKRIYLALTEAGIPFASNAVVVRGGDREEGAAAASGLAAAQARQAAPAG